MLISLNLSQNMYALRIFRMPSLHPDADAVTEKKNSHLGYYIEGKEKTSSVAIPSLQQRPQ